MQINRLFEIIYILLERKKVTAKELAQRFEVSTRTVYRDIETLSAQGIPVYMSKGKGGGISLVSGYVLNKMVLTDDEKTSLMSSLKAVSCVDLSEQNSAIDKLSSMLGDKNSNWIEVDFSHWSSGDKEKELFNNLKNAIINGFIVKLSYTNAKGESNCREIEPLKLCFKGQDWYVYGFCKLKNDYRFFKLRRISNLSVTENKFHRENPKRIFPDKKYSHPKTKPIKLKISKKQAYRVYDEFLQYEIDENGDFIVKVTISERHWMFSYIGTFGKYAEILEPENARQEYIDFLQKTLNNYL